MLCGCCAPYVDLYDLCEEKPVSVIELDFIEGITYDPMLSPIKNCHPLEYLPEGIHQLALSVRAEEIRQNSEQLCPSFMVDYVDAKTYLIACKFHWFANTLVNYARLVAFVEITNKNGWMVEHLSDKKTSDAVNLHCREYVKRVVPSIYLWRNKVSAHFAATNPFSDDNTGTLQDSMHHPISYMRPYYFASSHTLSKGGEESAIPQWSLTQTFENLTSRFFPQRKLPVIDQIVV